MIRINLVPREERGKSQRAVDWRRMGLIVAASVTLVVVAYGVFNSILIGMHNARIEAMAPDMRELRRRESDLRSLRSENRDYQQQITAARDFVGEASNRRMIGMLRGMAEVTPQGVWMNQIFFSPDGSITTNGYASTPEALSAFLEALKGMPDVKTVELPTMGGADEGTLRNQVFSLRIETGGDGS